MPHKKPYQNRYSTLYAEEWVIELAAFILTSVGFGVLVFFADNTTYEYFFSAMGIIGVLLFMMLYWARRPLTLRRR